MHRCLKSFRNNRVALKRTYGAMPRIHWLATEEVALAEVRSVLHCVLTVVAAVTGTVATSG